MFFNVVIALTALYLLAHSFLITLSRNSFSDKVVLKVIPFTLGFLLAVHSLKIFNIL